MAPGGDGQAGQAVVAGRAPGSFLRVIGLQLSVPGIGPLPGAGTVGEPRVCAWQVGCQEGDGPCCSVLLRYNTGRHENRSREGEGVERRHSVRGLCPFSISTPPRGSSPSVRLRSLVPVTGRQDRAHPCTQGWLGGCPQPVGCCRHRSSGSRRGVGRVCQHTRWQLRLCM